MIEELLECCDCGDPVPVSKAKKDTFGNVFCEDCFIPEMPLDGGSKGEQL